MMGWLPEIITRSKHMAEESQIILIPSVPEDMFLDFLFKTDKGIVVQASADDIQNLKNKGIPVAELFSSGNDYAGAVLNQTTEEALAVIDSAQNQALAALTPDERKQFGIA
jgi:DNA gyrase/topoisomerase IV subunit A